MSAIIRINVEEINADFIERLKKMYPHETIEIRRSEIPSFVTEEMMASIEEERRKLDEIPGYGLDWEEVKKTLKFDEF